MNIKIHRGTQEIGGSCVEISTSKTRILVDFGMPLVEKNGSEFDFATYKTMSVSELVKSGLLPDVPDIYTNEANKIDGVIISHPHQDHYGLVHYLNDNLKFYIGEAAFRIINTGNLFINKGPLFKSHHFIEDRKSFTIGDIKITPYLMDHSAFDSYSFLIEGDGKKLFYSGDFRGHGRKSYSFKNFIKNPPTGSDYLLLEGTMIGRSQDREKTEDDLKSEFETLFREDKINLVYTSGQNIDRLVSIYKACNSSGKTLIIDPYIASILVESARFAGIHHPSQSFRNIKVLFPWFLTKRMLKTPHKEYIYKFSNYKITRDKIAKSPEKYVMVVRPSMKFDIERIDGIDGGNIIYSLWDGYLKKEPTKGFVEYLIQRGFTLHKIHTSGHADIPTLKDFVNAIKPGHIIPIHTFSSDQYKYIFNCPVLELTDGQLLKT